ncbi:MAG: hypothetical protein ACI35O_06185 [Bacillaceae bacterium]
MITFILMIIIPFSLFLLLLKIRSKHFFLPCNKKIRVVAIVTTSIVLFMIYSLFFIMKLSWTSSTGKILLFFLYASPYVWTILAQMYFYKKAEKNVKVAMKKERNIQRLKAMGLSEKINM